MSERIIRNIVSSLAEKYNFSTNDALIFLNGRKRKVRRVKKPKKKPKKKAEIIIVCDTDEE